MATAGVTGNQFNATAAINPAATTTSTDSTTLANNFQSFLLMLTTQLQNQNPLDPLDTNQFTQQLVQFSQVEQLLKSNQQLEALVSLQKTAQNTQALGFIGATVVVDGSSATLPNAGTATWGFNVAKPSAGTITITNPAGQTVYSSNYTLQAGVQQFTWDGKGKDGTQWPPGQYKMTVTAKDALGNPVAVSTEVQGVVDSVDVSSTPPVLMIGGEEFTVDKVKRIVRPTS